MREPIHPGETLREDLDALGMSAAALARRIEVPVNRITQILNGQRRGYRRHGTTPRALLRDLGRVLAQPPEAPRAAACGAREWRGDRPAATLDAARDLLDSRATARLPIGCRQAVAQRRLSGTSRQFPE